MCWYSRVSWALPPEKRGSRPSTPVCPISVVSWFSMSQWLIVSDSSVCGTLICSTYRPPHYELCLFSVPSINEPYNLQCQDQADLGDILCLFTTHQVTASPLTITVPHPESQNSGFWQGSKEVSCQLPIIKSLGKIIVKIKLQIIQGIYLSPGLWSSFLQLKINSLY